MNCDPGVAAEYNLPGPSLEKEQCLDEENVNAPSNISYNPFLGKSGKNWDWWQSVLNAYLWAAAFLGRQFGVYCSSWDLKQGKMRRGIWKCMFQCILWHPEWIFAYFSQKSWWYHNSTNSFLNVRVSYLWAVAPQRQLRQLCWFRQMVLNRWWLKKRKVLTVNDQYWYSDQIHDHSRQWQH